VRKGTLLDLSDWPPERIAGFKTLLKGAAAAVVSASETGLRRPFQRFCRTLPSNATSGLRAAKIRFPNDWSRRRTRVILTGRVFVGR